MSADRDFAREMYPFLHSPTARVPAPLGAVLESVRNSTLLKCDELIALRRELAAEYASQFDAAADEMMARFDGGGKLIAFGNGGSATDADDAATDCIQPPHPDWRALPAVSLPADGATITAVANDVGIEQVFVRQLHALAERGDIALGFSTSGYSGNVLAAFADARRRGLLTIALTGYDGGAIARSGDVDFTFVARREFVPRIQEGHATIWHTLLATVQAGILRRTGVAV